MCGIFGIHSSSEKVQFHKLKNITSLLNHRGPDSSGVWLDDNQNIGLGHTRLSIIDTSKKGSQPMISRSGRYIITFNGEIYNFEELRNRLLKKNYFFNGFSDTEVLLAALELWGVKNTLTKISGMFSIGLWDTIEKSMYLIRDRFGIKPLYYTLNDGCLIFASELKPIVKWIGKLPDICTNGLSDYMKSGYVSAPLSIFENIYKLMPGNIIKYEKGILSNSESFWNIDEVVLESKKSQYKHKKDAMLELDKCLTKSISKHMVSDVSLGALLSGGIDSSTVVALMQKQSLKKIKTFTIGFDDNSFNEAKYASAIAKYLGTEHNELYISEAEALKTIPFLPIIYDEPFADTSQIPTSIIASLAKKQVTVALSGDGGDELFGGYNRYLFIQNFYKKINIYPIFLRKFLSRIMLSYTPSEWNKIFKNINVILPKNFSSLLPGQKLNKIGDILLSNSLSDVYQKLISQWERPSFIINKDLTNNTHLNHKHLSSLPGLQDTEQQMIWDSKSYLVDDILTKVDRASMNNGLEVRVPFLDHKVFEIAWKIPIEMKISGNQGKLILKEILYKYLPKDLVDHPKMGFGVPIDDWLRGGLFDWANDLLCENKIKKEGFFNYDSINQIWKNHYNNQKDFGGKIWTLLMFETWYEKAKKWV